MRTLRAAEKDKRHPVQQPNQPGGTCAFADED